MRIHKVKTTYKTVSLRWWTKIVGVHTNGHIELLVYTLAVRFARQKIASLVISLDIC